MPNEVFDAAFISASPLALSEALLLARSGQRVVVFDRQQAIGGAWRYEDVLGYRDVEVGCHIFISNPAVAVMLSKLWGVSLWKMEPEPRQMLFWRGRYFSERYGGRGQGALFHGLSALEYGARWLLGQGRAGEHLLRAMGLSFAKALSRAWRWARAARSRRRDFVYPVGGTGEMVRALRARIAEAGIELRLGTEVETVTIGDGGASLQLADGSTVEATQVVLTRGSRINSLNGLVIPSRETIRQHWVAVLDDASPRRFSYMVFNGHASLRRVSDVTGFAKTATGDAVESGRKILCFFVHNALLAKGREQAETHLLTLFKQRGWIGASATLVRGGWWEDPETSRDYGFITQLHPANPAIRVIPNINLGVFLRDNVHRLAWSASSTAKPVHIEPAREAPDVEEVTIFD